MKSITARAVGPFKMSDPQFAAFVADLRLTDSWTDSARLGVFGALSVFSDAVVSYAPDRVSQKLELFERKVVTNFLTRTDYLQVDPSREEVSFVGDAGCSSPFAKFQFS